jgi:hypothetical protein
MFPRFVKFMKLLAVAVVFLALAAIGTLPTAAYGQHGHGGGHHGGAHSGFGHGGFSHGGYGGYGRGGYFGGYGRGLHGGYGYGLYGGYGQSRYGHSGIGHRGGSGYGHNTPSYGYHYWPGYGRYGYGGSGYGSYYGLYGSGLYGQRYSAAYPPTSDSLAGVSSGGASNPVPQQDYLSLAETAFRAGDYAEAARLANHAVVDTPRNGRLFLLVSQALFATGDYQGATAALYQATALLEPKDWGYVVQNFRNYYRNDDYVRQMEGLTKFIEDNPEATYARTLRGYHFGFLGYKDAARHDLAKAVELEKRDELASQLLEQFSGTAPASSSPATPANPPEDSPEPRGEGHQNHTHSKDGV